MIKLYRNNHSHSSTGKTLQIISYLAHLKENNGRGPYLVIGPLSITQNWKNEFSTFCPSMKVITYIGNQTERQDIQYDIIDYVRDQEDQDDPNLNFDVLVTTYDMILYDLDFLSRFNWRCVIIDEAHRLKNKDSKLYTSLKENFEMPRIFLITGTPVQNNLKELFALLHFIMPDIFSSESEFLTRFPIKQIMSNNSTDNNEKLKQLHQCLRPFLLRRKKSEIAAELPTKQELILYTKLSNMQRKYYKGILMKDRKALGSNNKKSLTNILLNLRKCCNHPYLFDGAEPEPYVEGEHIINNSGKMVLLDKLLKKLKQEGHKVLIFSQMTTMLDILQDYMHFRQYTYERLDGSVRGEERFSAIDNFTAESEVFVFLLSTRAGGVGLNLVAADTVIFMDLDFNPQMDLQAQERVYRIGQSRDVTIYRLITEDTVEEIMMKRSFKKMALSLNAIEKGGFGSQAKNDDLGNIDITNMIQYGLHKMVEDDQQNQQQHIDYDKQLQNMKIEDILGEKKVVSFGEMTNPSLGIEASEETEEATILSEENQPNEIYMYEGRNYNKKKNKVEKGKKKSSVKKQKKKVVLDEEDEDDFEDEDATALHTILNSPGASSIMDDEDSPTKRTYNLRKRKLSFDSDDDRPRKKKKSNYISNNIIVPEDYDFATADEGDYPEPEADFDEVEISQGTLLNNDKKINYMIGDVTSPTHINNNPVFIINCLSDGGFWPRGGLCGAITKNVSEAPKYSYEQAGKNDDLRLGDAHLVDVSDDYENTYVVNVIAQHYDTDKQTHSGIQLYALEAALYKVQYAARSMNATVHMPRIGFGLPNFNWYGVERVIKKCLVSSNIATYVYYYKRGTTDRGKAVPITPSPSAVSRKSVPSTSSSHTKASSSSSTSPSSDTKNRSTASPDTKPLPATSSDKDIFEDLRFLLHNIPSDEFKELKRKIIVNGGTVATLPLASPVQFIIVNSRTVLDDDELEQVLQSKNAKDAELFDSDWIDTCIKQQKIVLPAT
jgi:hypothetical protein